MALMGLNEGFQCSSAAEHMLSMFKALGSIPSTTNN